MKNIITKLGLILLVFVLASSQLFAQDDLKNEVQEAADKIAKAYVLGDLNTLASFWIDDAISLPHYEKMIKGKDAIIEREKETLKAGVIVHSINFTTLEVWESGDLVYEIGKYGIALTIPGMPKPLADYGKYLSVWERQSDGSLKMKADIWNTDLNPWTEGN